MRNGTCEHLSAFVESLPPGAFASRLEMTDLSTRIVENDASIMTSDGGRAGACAGVRVVKHPISLAKCIMNHSPHVLLVGDGAERFARDQVNAGHNVDLINPANWFYNMRPKSADGNALEGVAAIWDLNYRTEEEKKFGTVGAVALDSEGRTAAATSTGGTNQKLPGRVGDSPLIGSGTWADSNVAVSCTGKGEVFIRQAVAHDVAARIKYAKQSLAEASRAVIQDEVPKMAGGQGGLIAVDRLGNTTLEFNTTIMFRGSIDSSGKRTVAVLK